MSVRKVTRSLVMHHCQTLLISRSPCWVRRHHEQNNSNAIGWYCIAEASLMRMQVLQLGSTPVEHFWAGAEGLNRCQLINLYLTSCVPVRGSVPQKKHLGWLAFLEVGIACWIKVYIIYSPKRSHWVRRRINPTINTRRELGLTTAVTSQQQSKKAAHLTRSSLKYTVLVQRTPLSETALAVLFSESVRDIVRQIQVSACARLWPHMCSDVCSLFLKVWFFAVWVFLFTRHNVRLLSTMQHCTEFSLEKESLVFTL